MYRNKILLPLVFVIICSFIFHTAYLSAETNQPTTKKIPVVDTYHGIEVIDNYRWLEDFENPSVIEWNKLQNDYARSILDTVINRELIQERLTELLGHASPRYKTFKQVGNYFFVLKLLPPAQHYYLVRYSSTEEPSTEKVIVNVDKIDKEHLTAIDFYSPSPDGKLVAVSLSEKGSESGNLFVFNCETGEKLDEYIPRVYEPTGFGAVAWKKDGSGFYYSRYPHKGERPDEDLKFYMQVYYHLLGTSFKEDRYVTGEQFPKIAEIISMELSNDLKLIIITVANGDGGEFEHFLMNESEEVTQLTQLNDLITDVHFGPDNSLYLLSHMDAPMGQILYLSQGETDLSKASVFVKECDAVIKTFKPARTKLYINELVGGPTQLKVIDLETNESSLVPAEPVSSFGKLYVFDDNKLLFSTTSYLTPTTYFIYNPENNSVSQTIFASTSPADFSQFEVYRDFAISKDGTKIPLNIIYKKGITLDGNNPTILTGYGGYRISLSPSFDAKKHLWLEQGGVYVIANLRGGLEYGEEWHSAGNLTNKQNVFDDFIACTEYLIKNGYTSPEKLVIEGGSNGGLLMGAAFTQHPEYYKVVVSKVGLYDMLRYEQNANGIFNIPEYGTVKNYDQFKALYAYSPYHNVKAGTKYPSILLTLGRYDGRVDPMQSRKMTAILQRENISDNPILLRSNPKAGHGSGSLSQTIELNTDIYSFIFSQLGIIYKYDK